MHLKTWAAALATLLATASISHAGGFSRGTANTDILFQDGTVSLENSATVVVPNKRFASNPVSALSGTEFSPAYVIPSLAVKYSPSDLASCALTYTTPFGGDTKFDVMNVRGKTEERFLTREYGATCAVFLPMSVGRLAFIGGVFYEKFEYDFEGFTFAGPRLTPLRFGLDSGEVGWRAGVAYDIPEYAFRTQLLYRSGTDHEATSTATLPALGVSIPTTGAGSLPQSLELKMQTGVAPGWLVFGSAKWTDWSVLDSLDLNLGGRPFSNTYEWRDGWTFNAGIGHEFNERFSGAVLVGYDRGVSTGWDYYGDVYTVAVSGAMKDSWGGKLTATAGLAFQEGVTETKNPAGMNAVTENSVGPIFQIRYDLKW